MSAEKFTDTRSPWFESYARRTPPWALESQLADSPQPPDADSDPTDEGWATEAIFDYYND